MQPTRTLPPALSLALLAKISGSGCVEGDIEPGYGAAGESGVDVVDETVLPEGVPAGFDGVIVIDRAAPGGLVLLNALDEEDWEALARMRTYKCTSIWHCFHKCPSYAKGCVCSIIFAPGNTHLLCKVIYWDDDPCDGEWGGLLDCEGGGGGRESELSLRCDPPADRGRYAKCTLETGRLDPNSLTFEWYSKHRRLDAHTGQLGMVWGGIATETLEIGVTVTPPSGRSEIMKETVAVRPRSWKLHTQSARLLPKWVNSIPGGYARWGLYSGGEPTPEALPVRAGTGPWEGTWIVAGNKATTMRFHNDLKGGGPEYAIGPKKHEDSVAIRKCGVSVRRVGVHALNKACRAAGRVDTFRQQVVAHEEEHELSLNRCIKRVNARRLKDVEAIVEPSQALAENEMKRLWLKGAVVALFEAKQTAQGPVRADIWKYRPGPWKYGLLTVGHTGRDGCPQI